MQQVSFTVVNKPFSIDVVYITGQQICIQGLRSNFPFSSLMSELERSKELENSDLQLALGERVFSERDMNRSLHDLGISEGAQVLCFYVSAGLRNCPYCEQKANVVHDVMVGATHEGWGQKWNTCQYDCVRCTRRIHPGEYVVACNACKCFWHGSCPLIG